MSSTKEAEKLAKKNKRRAEYKALHPEIFTYNQEFIDRFLDPKVGRNEDPKTIVTEVAEQLYHFQLFTPEFCRLLIEETEHANKWETNFEKTEEPHPMIEGAVDICEPDTTTTFDDLPGMEEVYANVINNHVRRIMEAMWVTFKLQKWDVPAVRKYEVDVIKQMDLHYDLETVAMVGYLNDAFTGGGTYFPRWKLTVGSHENVKVGSVVIYPGGVSHEHMALPITSGKRYALANSFY